MTLTPRASARFPPHARVDWSLSLAPRLRRAGSDGTDRGASELAEATPAAHLECHRFCWLRLCSLLGRAIPRLRCLVVLPTRDLVAQVYRVFQQWAAGSALRIKAVMGQVGADGGGTGWEKAPRSRRSTTLSSWKWALSFGDAPHPSPLRSMPTRESAEFAATTRAAHPEWRLFVVLLSCRAVVSQGGAGGAGRQRDWREPR